MEKERQHFAFSKKIFSSTMQPGRSQLYAQGLNLWPQHGKAVLTTGPPGISQDNILEAKKQLKPLEWQHAQGNRNLNLGGES